MGRKNKKQNEVVFISRAGRTKVYATQPKPTFFSDAEIERMSKQPGSYQYKGWTGNDAR